jgi:hypothetical protein
MAVKDWVVVNPFGVLRSTVNPMDAPDVEGELRCGHAEGAAQTTALLTMNA